MKIKALILSFVLVTVALFTAVPVSVGATDAAGNEAEVLMSLGITDHEDIKGESISRGQFISFVMDALKYDIETGEKIGFEDVDEEHIYADAIYKAKLMGIISGAQSNRFEPDKPITYNAAVKIMVSALGYMKIAEYYGGYPIGYTLVAKDIDLLKKVPAGGENALSADDTVRLLYNFIHCDICKITNVEGNTQVGQQRQYGKSLISEKYNLKKVSGVVKSGGVESSIPEFKTEVPVLEIAGITYKTSVKNAEKYIGFNVDAYVDKESEVVRAVYVRNNNTYVDISGEDIAGFVNGTVEVLKENKSDTVKYMLDKGFYYVKNGRASEKAPEFTKDNIKVRLIDNNGDKVYDFVIKQEFEYMVVSSVSSIDGDVLDVFGGKKVHFGKTAGYHYTVEINGQNEDYTKIPVGSVLTYTISDDKYVVRAKVCTDTVKGEVSEIADDYVVVDGTSYKVNEYFEAKNVVKPGISGEFLLASDNTITAYKSDGQSKLRYGYLTDAFETQTGLAHQVAIRVLDQSGQKFSYSFSENIRLDDVYMKNNDPRVFAEIFNGAYPKYQVLRYGLDENGKINRLDTYEDVDHAASPLEKYCSGKNENDMLTRNVHNKEAYHSYNYRSFLPFTTLGDSSVVFSIPTDIADINNTEGEDKRLKKYIDDDFNVVDTTTFDGTKKYVIDVYDQDEFLQPGVVVVYRGSAGGFSISSRMTPQLVSSVTDSIDDNGVLTKKVTMLSGSNFKSYYINSSKLSEMKEDNKIPKAGDIIKYALDSEGTICDISICITYNHEADKPQIVNQGSDQVYYPVHIGKPFSHNTSTLALKISEGPAYTSYYSAAPVDSIGSFTVSSGVNYYRYDAKTGIAKKIEISDIRDIVSAGEDGASVVATHSSYHNITIVVEYLCGK